MMSTAPTGGFGGFGAAAKGGFGAVTATGGTGFGTAATGSTGNFGGFGTATGSGFAAVTTTGTFGGFGAGKGFGTTVATPAQPHLPQYKGIKGPGSSTEWLHGVNLSILRDDVVFEDLPVPLQQHLTDFHNFIQAEHDAKQVVEAFLTDSATPNATPAPSYRELVKKMNQLASGENAVDGIRVECFEREVQAHRLGQTLDKCEDDILDYMKNVWKPLSEIDFTQLAGGNRPKPASEPFQRILREIQGCMDAISAAVSELEAAVVPCGRRVRGPVTDDASRSNAAPEPPCASASEFLTKLTGGVELPDVPPPGLGSAASAHPVSRINASLSNQLTTLLNLAAWTLRLHTRADSARDLFVHNYGTSEAELLLAQQHQQAESSAGPRRPFLLPSSTGAAAAEVNQDTVGDIHRRSAFPHRSKALSNGERKMQYDVLLERKYQTAAPAAAPMSTATASGTASSVAGATLGATSSTSTTATGFGAPQSLGTIGGATIFGAGTSAADPRKTLNKTGRS